MCASCHSGMIQANQLKSFDLIVILTDMIVISAYGILFEIKQ